MTGSVGSPEKYQRMKKKFGEKQNWSGWVVWLLLRCAILDEGSVLCNMVLDRGEE